MLLLHNGGYTCVGVPRPCRSLLEQQGGRRQVDALRAGLPPLSGGCPAGLHAPCPQWPECMTKFVIVIIVVIIVVIMTR